MVPWLTRWYFVFYGLLRWCILAGPALVAFSLTTAFPLVSVRGKIATINRLEGSGTRQQARSDRTTITNGGWHRNSSNHPSFSEYDKKNNCSPPLPTTTTTTTITTGLTRRNAITTITTASASMIVPSFGGNVPRANAINPLTSTELDQ